MAFALLLPGTASLAQNALPAPLNQDFLRQQQHERALRELQPPRPPVRSIQYPRSPAAALPVHLVLDETPCLRLHLITLHGELASEFQWALAAADVAPDGTPDPALGRCLGTQGVAQVTQRVQQQILARGYVTTRVLAQAQDLSTGTLALTLFPGRVQNVRVDDAHATTWNALPLRRGDLLRLNDLEQAIDNFRRLPTVQASLDIEPARVGGKPGDSDIAIHWQQSRFWRVSSFVEDSGSRATGKIQGGLTLACDHCLRLNDLFYASASNSLGDLGGADPGSHSSRARVLHYELPWGYSRLAFNYNLNNYRQTVAGISQPYLYSGQSETGDITLSRVVQRSAQGRTTLAVKTWLRNSRNFIDDTEIEVQHRRMAGWELGISRHQSLGRAAVDASLAYRHGTGVFASQPAPEEDLQPGISRPQLIQAELRVERPFEVGRERLRYVGNARAQWNRTPLIQQDQFAIGGRYTVRGFDGERYLAAERGWLLRNELALAMGESGQELYLGLDHGEVGGPSSVLLAGTALTGTVLGWRGSVQGRGTLGYDFFIGSPLRKPQALQTASVTTGFTINWTY